MRLPNGSQVDFPLRLEEGKGRADEGGTLSLDTDHVEAAPSRVKVVDSRGQGRCGGAKASTEAEAEV